MGKIARKLMANYIDASLTSSVAYERLGKDLEEYTVEMNANVETKNNILGESSTNIDSYQPQAGVEPYYADEDDAMYAKLQDIIDNRRTLDDLKTTVVEVHLWEEKTTGVYVAYREDAVIEVSSYGGDTTGYQIPFNLYYIGNRVKGLFTLATKSFVADTATLAELDAEVVAGTTATTTKISDVIGESASGTLMYKTAASIIAPNYNDSTTGYTALTLDTDITVTDGHKIIVVDTAASKVIGASAIMDVVVGS